MGFFAPSSRSVYLNDTRPPFNNGGASIAGTQTRTLNTITGDTSFCTLAANQFTLSPGVYTFSGRAPAFGPGGISQLHAAWVYDVTNATAILLGSTAYASNLCQTDSVIEGTLNVTTTTVFEIQHNTSNAVATGLGQINVTGLNSVFTTLVITRMG